MKNKSPEITDDGPASLPLLPGDLLMKIMSLAMASNVPVFLWLFQNLNHIHDPTDLYKPWIRDGTSLRSQQQHRRDWVSVTGTCRRLREYGIPAFFRTKSFVVPPRMLSGLLDGRIRSSTLDMAMDWISKIVVPVNSVINGTDFMILPKYHRFTRLSAMTIRALDSQNLIISDSMEDRPWPQETPKELHDLLRQLGLRVDTIKLKLVIMARAESVVPSLIESIERAVYPSLRTLIQRRAKSGLTPP